MTIARRIREARVAKNLSQAELARQVGVSRATAHNWEKEKSKGGQFPARKYVVTLANVLGLHPSALDPYSGDSVTPSIEPSYIKLVPVLEWDELDVWLGGELDMAANAEREYVQADNDAHEDTIVLYIKDESMWPEFRIMDKILIEPHAIPTEDDCVLVRVDKTGQKLFRHYVPRRNGAYDLVADNPEWPTVTINASNPATILGVLYEHRRKRRR